VGRESSIDTEESQDPAPSIPTVLRNRVKTRQILLTEMFRTRKQHVVKPSQKKKRQTTIFEFALECALLNYEPGLLNYNF